MSVGIIGYSGCCGSDILYGFSYDPKSPAVRPAVFNPTTRCYEKPKGGKTNEESFLSKLANQREVFKKGGRMYSLILNETQYNSFDQAWPKIFKKAGFEFVRRWCNANHNDEQFLYLFVLCDDLKGSCKGDHKVPPKGWDDLEGPPPKETLFGKLKEVLVQPAAT